jgi:hypothetical protein
MTTTFKCIFLLLGIVPSFWVLASFVLGRYGAGGLDDALHDASGLIFLHALPVLLIYLAARFVGHLGFTAFFVLIVGWCAFWHCVLSGQMAMVVPFYVELFGCAASLTFALIVLGIRKFRSKAYSKRGKPYADNAIKNTRY